MQACPLFSNARKLASASGGLPCPTKARLEKTARTSVNVVQFVDPPGVAGDGNPSGGQHPSYGVLTFSIGYFNSSWLATCDAAEGSIDLRDRFN
jgi:hypothetical protein